MRKVLLAILVVCIVFIIGHIFLKYFFGNSPYPYGESLTLSEIINVPNETIAECVYNQDTENMTKKEVESYESLLYDKKIEEYCNSTFRKAKVKGLGSTKMQYYEIEGNEFVDCGNRGLFEINGEIYVVDY